MVPLALTNYLTVSAGVGATLIGLIFVAVSIAPERTVMGGIIPLYNPYISGATPEGRWLR
jgi:hypothetical protein